jgi:hypothetical protein
MRLLFKSVLIERWGLIGNPGKIKPHFSLIHHYATLLKKTSFLPFRKSLSEFIIKKNFIIFFHNTQNSYAIMLSIKTNLYANNKKKLFHIMRKFSYFYIDYFFNILQLLQTTPSLFIRFLHFYFFEIWNLEKHANIFNKQSKICSCNRTVAF